MTRREHRRSSLDEFIAALDVESRAVKYLDASSNDTAVVNAIKTALELTTIWEIEERKLFQNGDRRLFFHIEAEERGTLYSAVAEYSQNPLWPQHLDSAFLELFSGLPQDTAAVTAYMVAAQVHFRGKQK